MVEKADPTDLSGTPRHLLLTIVCVLATILQTLDTTIANIALPHIRGSLGASEDQVTWVVTSYVVAAAISTPAMGFLVGRFGRKRVYVISIVGFTIASVLCGASQSLGEVVAMRALQGAIGAFLVPISQSVILDLYPGERQALGIAAWGVGSIVGPIVGPTLGGYLTEYLSWPWVFYVNVPLGILSAIGIAVMLPQTNDRNPVRFDALGFVLIGVALSSLQLALDRGTMLDWFSSKEITAEFSIAALTFYLFLVHTFTTTRPLFNPQVFKDRNFVVGVTLAFVTNMAVFSLMTLVPLMMQTLMGYPVITTGIILLPRAFGSGVAMFVSGRMSMMLEPRLVAALGLFGTAASLWQLSTFDLSVSDNILMLNGALQGLTVGMIAVPIMNIAFSRLDPKLRTDGTAIVSLTRNLSGSIGVSVCETMITRLTQVNHAQLSEHISRFNPAMQSTAVLGAEHGQAIQMAVGLNAEVSRQAAMIAYIDVYRLCAFILITTLILIPLMRGTPVRGLAETAHVEL
jgi:DHA2 family multidrug resistance protein